MSGFNLPPGVTTGMIEDQIEPEYFLVHRDDLAKLAKINRALYGDGSTLDPDTRRDMANLLDLVRQNIADMPY